MNLESLITTITEEFFMEFLYDKFVNDWHVMHLIASSEQTAIQAIEHFKL